MEVSGAKCYALYCAVIEKYGKFEDNVVLSFSKDDVIKLLKEVKFDFAGKDEFIAYLNQYSDFDIKNFLNLFVENKRECM